MWILQSAEATFRLKPGAIKTVGRAPRADFILDVALVSRLHCRLTAADDQLEVLDLKSTNGTYVNDKRVDQAKLSTGDKLRIGRVAMTVERAKSEGADCCAAACGSWCPGRGRNARLPRRRAERGRCGSTRSASRGRRRAD